MRRDQQIEVELKEKSKWVRNILSKVGLDVNEWAENLSMNDLRRIRVDLKKLDIEILDDSDNGLKIYYAGNLIAEWIRPRYVLVENPKERDPKYRYYLQMHTNCRSVFEEKEKKKEK